MKHILIAFLMSMVAVSAATTASVPLGWTPADDHDSNTVFRLYQGTAVDSFPTMFEVGKPTNYTVGGLTPGVQYFFYVTAINPQNMESDQSNILPVTIPTAGVPTLLTLSEFNRNETRTLISWQPSPPNELVFQYEINYKSENDLEWTILLTDKTANNSITTDSTSIYTVQVRAVGPAGPGPWLIRTLPGIVPRIVQSLYISPKSQITYTYKP